MKRVNVVIGLCIMFAWGLINEFLHVMRWNSVLVSYIRLNGTLVDMNVLFDAVVFLVAAVLIATAIIISFNDELIK